MPLLQGVQLFTTLSWKFIIATFAVALVSFEEPIICAISKASPRPPLF